MPTPVESITHDEKRTNLPTADAHEFVSPQVEAVRQVAYARDASLDPQLIWRGKYPDGDPALASDLVADAPPIYIQEKIDPRVLVENLRQTARAGEVEPELTLFDTFDGLDELDAVEFYRHEANWSNRMILGDSLQVMASLAERENLRGKVQMIYIDPPYGIKFGSNWQVSARKRDVKDGKLEDAVREAEQIKAFRDTWELGIHSYLSYLRDRLLVARELLTESGSCFVQIGDENVHLVRSLMDEVFGPENFVVEIVAQKTTGAGSPGELASVPAVVDYLLWFSKSRDLLRYRQIWMDKVAGGVGASLYTQIEESNGLRRPMREGERSGILAEGSRIFGIDNLVSSSGVDKTRYAVQLGGREYRPNPGVWKTSQRGMENLKIAGRVHAGRGRNLGYVRYLNDFPAYPLTNIWTDTVGQNQFGGEKNYVVQTANKIIERCVLMCTDPGDLVLDPTCGSGTTAYVAEQWGRRWITVDTSRVALALARQRLMGAKYPYYLLADSDKGRHKEQEVTGIPLPPAPTKDDVRRGFVYERVQHITLKSIANNPDIREGLTRQEIDEAVKRHADFEMRYDRPYEDRRRVRVGGPFTVESLSPHRSLAFAETPEAAGRESISQRAGAQDGEGPTFEQTILDNLRKAGVQNGRTRERITFATLDTHAGLHVQAVGERLGGPSGDASGDGAGRATRIGVAIGPQYGTVSPPFIKAAAKEAIKEGEIDLLCVLGFAFDPQATGVTAEDGVTVEVGDAGFASVAGERQLGRIKVLLVRMNADLLMGEDLKKTGAGNLFTVFGEPDIEISHPDADSVVVTLKGVDVYDPTTGEIRTNDTGQIALWMIDTAYNEESFFVRHCYFTGGNDPYRRLKAALKAEIDEDAWASLYSTVSRPFPRPGPGKIAVKVINDYGDEVMKVFEV